MGATNVVDDRRLNNRIDAFAIGLQVANSIDGEPIGIIGNLSLGGMMLISQRQLHPDGVLQLTIQVPSTLGGTPISIGAKILWCTPANSPDEFWAGLETIDIAASGREALQKLIGQLDGAH